MRQGESQVYSIPPGQPFLDALAAGLLRRSGGDPLALARHTVLLPTRRACRALEEAFLRAAEGSALLLPRLLPLGDLDAEELLFAEQPAASGAHEAELPPAMPPLRRLLLLARLIGRWGEARGESYGDDQAIRLAAELARLLDQVETEGLSFERLAELVPEEHAEHWQVTLKFLAIATEQWPAIQRAEGCVGPGERRRRLLELQAEAWRREPPQDPVVAAGTTGSIPATAALLGVVSTLPKGMIVLPGLDAAAAEDAWTAIERDPTHPQHGLATLLARLGIARAQVSPWPDPPLMQAAPLRARLVAAALHPAEAPADWDVLGDAVKAGDLEAALAGVQRIDCPGPGEEARVIALLLRQALERPEQRAALVTPDRALARRVAAELMRWGIAVDDSAGMPLAETPPGAFLRLTAEMVAGGLAPLALLAALKHPLAAGGRQLGEFRAQVRALELRALRGPRPAPAFAGLRALLRGAAGAPLRAWLGELERIARPFARALTGAGSLGALLEAHVAFAEALAATAEEAGAARLWAGEAGRAAAEFVAALREAARDAPAPRGQRYPALLASLLAGQAVRPRYGAHPRLSIWGPLEARLQQADLLILGGLNEATWPAEVDPGPWLSRPMREAFGLPSPERRIGLAAHDFAQALCAPRVYLTRATRVEGTPSVPSRWLLRLEALLEALAAPDLLRAEAPRWLAWAEALDRPAQTRPSAPPAPRPPLAARPRGLSVSGIETWMRSPYDLYAREILRLRALDPLDADPGAAELGTLVHAALERFVQAFPEHLPEDPEAELIAAGRAEFLERADRPGVWAFWWPRFRRIARWFATLERARRGELARCHGEVRGLLHLEAPAGPFELRAKADRIELDGNGELTVVDYKTGSLPSKTEIALGIAPQLPLEAAIAEHGGFQGLPAGAVRALQYWRLTGGNPPGELKAVAGDPATHAAGALDGVRRLVAAFDDPATPYHAVPRPRWAGRFSDYGHLARVKEWAALPGEEGES